jgi:coenzyme F420 hydrogenase subunit beta
MSAAVQPRDAKAPCPALDLVLRGRLCMGCGGCAAVAPGRIEMHMPNGQAQPRQTGPVSAAENARIAQICPGLGLSQSTPEAGAEDHPIWGPVLGLRAGHAADPALRRQASSGGGLSALLTHLLDTGAVDFVLQTSASEDDPLGNATVISRDGRGVFDAAGSRYAPSSPLAGIDALLDGAARFAFVGKPCDVAALRALGRDDPRVAAQIPIMLSFFCAGVPSRHGAAKVVETLGFAPEDVAAFRYRGDGWPGRATATSASGESRGMSYADSWGNILSRHVAFRCKICPDGTGGAADVVCADAWDTDERGYPVFEDGEGTSLIMSRTAVGEALVRAAEAAGRLETRPFAIAAIAPMQPGQLTRRRMALARLLAMRLLGRPTPQYRGFHLLRAARQAGLRRNLRDFIGMLRRLRAKRR